MANNNLSWTGSVDSDWNDAQNWSPSLAPTSGDDVTIDASGAVVTIYNSTVSVNSLTIDNSGATVFDDLNTMLTANTLTVQAGTFELDTEGTVLGGVLQATGGQFAWKGGTLSGVTYHGTLEMSASAANLQITGGLTLEGAGGTGDGTLDLTGVNSFLYVHGTQTLDHATLNIGNDVNNSSLVNADSNATLTFGANLTIEHVGKFAQINGGGLSSAIVNHGTIDAGYSIAGGASLIVNPLSFTNYGTINVSHGDSFYFAGATGVNYGTITVGTGSSLLLEGSFTDSGTITNSGGTIYLDGVTYNGTLDMSAAGSTYTAVNGVTVLDANAGPGEIDLTGIGSVLTFQGDQTLDYATLEIGSNGVGVASQLYAFGTPSTLTLGSHLTVEQTGQNAQITGSGLATIVNEGAITASVSGGFFTINPAIFTNSGTITVSNGDTVQIDNISYGSTGHVNIDGSSTLELVHAASQSIFFTGSSGGTLTLDAPTTYGGSIFNFDIGDLINLENIDATGASISGPVLIVDLVGGGTLNIDLGGGSFTGDSVQATLGTHSIAISLQSIVQQQTPSSSFTVTGSSADPSVQGSLGYEFAQIGNADGTLVLGTYPDPLPSASPLSLYQGTVTTIDTGGNSDTISAVFSGSGGLAKDGAGTLVLTGINTYSGGTEIIDGTLEGAAGNTTNVGSLSHAITIDANALLQFDTTSHFDTAFIGTLDGDGGVLITAGPDGPGQIDLDFSKGFADSHTGGTTIAGGATLEGSAGGNVEIDDGTVDVHLGSLDLGTAFTIGASGHLEIDITDINNVGPLDLTIGATIQIDDSIIGSTDFDAMFGSNLGNGQDFSVTASGSNTLVTIVADQGMQPTTSVVSLGTDTGLDGELASAITFAETNSVGSVTFTPNFTGDIVLGNELPTITSDLVIDGTGAGSITIDGSGNDYLVEVAIGATLTFTDIREVDGYIGYYGAASPGATATVVFNTTSGTTDFSGYTDHYSYVTLEKDGAGTLVIDSGSEIYGAVQVTAGTLVVSYGSDVDGDILISAGGTVEAEGGDFIDGSLFGTVTIDNGATLQLDPQEVHTSDFTFVAATIVFDTSDSSKQVGTVHFLTDPSTASGQDVYVYGSVCGAGDLLVDGGGELYLEDDLSAFSGTLHIGAGTIVDATLATISTSLQVDLQASGAELVIDGSALETPGGYPANAHLALTSFAHGARIELTNLDSGGDMTGATASVSSDGTQIVVDLHDSTVQGFPDDFVTIDGSFGLFSGGVSVQGDQNGNVVIVSNSTAPQHISIATAAALAGGTSTTPLAIALGGNLSTEVNLPGGVLDLSFVQFNTNGSTTPVVLFDTAGSANVTLPGLLPSNGKPLEFAATKGNNTIVGGAAPVEIFGGTDVNGQDQITAGSGGGSLVGGAGMATIDAGSGDGTDWGVGHGATVWGALGGGALLGGGNYSMLVSRGNSTATTSMTASTHASALHQFFQGDTVGGSTATDNISLSTIAGVEDIVVAGSGITNVQTFNSNDAIMGGSGHMTIGGGTTTENLIYIGSSSTSEATSIAGSADATVYAQGGGGNETLSASFGGSSTIIGGTGNTTFFGAAGNGLMFSQGASGAHDVFQFADQTSPLGTMAGSFVVGGFTAANDTLQITVGSNTALTNAVNSQHIVTLTASDTSYAPFIGQSALQILLSDGEKIDIVGMTTITAGSFSVMTS